MIHDLSTHEFIEGVIDGRYNENDVYRYCKAQYSLQAFSDSLFKAACLMIISKGVKGGFCWNNSKRRFEFEELSFYFKDERVYLGDDFSRVERAYAVVCELKYGKQVHEEQEPQQGKEKDIERYIIGNNKEATIQAIKSLVSGKKGKQPAAVIFVAVSDGYMSKPTFDILKAAFGIVGTKSAFNSAYSKYNDNGVATKTHANEINAVRAALKRLLEGAS